MLPSQPNGRATFVNVMIDSNLIAPRPGPRRDRPPRPTAGATAIGRRQGSGPVASRRGRGSGAGPWEGRLLDGSPAPNSGGRLHGSVSGDRDELHQSAPPRGRAPFGAGVRHLARGRAIWRGGAPFGAGVRHLARG